MTADSGASSHFIDNRLLSGIELKMNHHVHLTPPVTINVAGNHRLYSVGHGVLVVQVLDHRDPTHSVQLPVTIVPGLRRHLLGGGSAATKEVNMTIAKNSYLDMGAFTVPLCKDSHCATLVHLNLTTDETSRTSETPFPAISGSIFKSETVLAVLRLLLKLLPCLRPVRANIVHKRLRHPI